MSCELCELEENIAKARFAEPLEFAEAKLAEQSEMVNFVEPKSLPINAKIVEKDEIVKVKKMQNMLDEYDDDEDDCAIDYVEFGSGGAKTPRIPTNFRVQLKASSEKNRMAYVVIKNKLNSIRGITFRQNGRLEKANYKGEPIAYIGVARKHIKLWLALDPNEYEPSRYYQRDESEKPKYAKVPMLVKIGSDRALTRVEELLNELAVKHDLQFKRKYEDKTLQELAYTLKGNALLKEKEPQLLREVIHVHDADCISNEDADRYLENAAKSARIVKNTTNSNGELVDIAASVRSVENAAKSERLAKKLATVSLDAIDESFIDGQKVTLERLKTKGLIGAEYDGYRVTAGERLTKPLHIIANDFSTSAVKMIVLTGGRAVQIRDTAANKSQPKKNAKK